MTKVFIIAEAGVNHNGSAAMALDLVDVAARCGADAVKFQTFSADKLVARGTAKAAYQSRETGAGDQHSMLKALELSQQTHRQLAGRCAERVWLSFFRIGSVNAGGSRKWLMRG